MNSTRCCVCERHIKTSYINNLHPDKYADRLVWFAEVNDSICEDCLHVAAAMAIATIGPDAIKERVLDDARNIPAKSTLGDVRRYLEAHGRIINVKKASA